MNILEDFESVITKNADGSQQMDVVDAKGNLIGTVARIRPASSDTKIAGDFPGLDPNYFVLDASGKLTTG